MGSTWINRGCTERFKLREMPFQLLKTAYSNNLCLLLQYS